MQRYNMLKYVTRQRDSRKKYDDSFKLFKLPDLLLTALSEMNDLTLNPDFDVEKFDWNKSGETLWQTCVTFERIYRHLWWLRVFDDINEEEEILSRIESDYEAPADRIFYKKFVYSLVRNLNTHAAMNEFTSVTPVNFVTVVDGLEQVLSDHFLGPDPINWNDFFGIWTAISHCLPNYFGFVKL